MATIWWKKHYKWCFVKVCDRQEVTGPSRGDRYANWAARPIPGPARLFLGLDFRGPRLAKCPTLELLQALWHHGGQQLEILQRLIIPRRPDALRNSNGNTSVQYRSSNRNSQSAILSHTLKTLPRTTKASQNPKLQTLG